MAPGFVEICRALLQDRRDVFDARQDFATSCFLVWTGNKERFSDRSKRLFDVKIRVAFPTWIDIEFPAHAR
jgi:hypothetical protein